MNDKKQGIELSRIHLVPYSHHDHAWTNTRQWHIWRYLEGFRLSLLLMRDQSDYTFLIDNVLHSLDVFQKYCPSLFTEFRQRVVEGRIAVSNGGMALVRPSNSGDELYLRNMACGRKELMMRLDCNPIRTFFNADTAVGHSQMPQLLKLCGHTAYRSSRPEMAHDLEQLPREMVWSGLDGSRVFFTRGNYGALMFGDCCDDELAWDDAVRRFEQEELKGRMPLQQSQDLYITPGCDDALPLTNLFDKPIDLIGFMKNWNRHETVEMFFSTPDQYLARLEQAELPVIHGVLDPCELSYNVPLRQKDALWYHRFEVERCLTRLEKIVIIAGSCGIAFDWTKINSLWQQLMNFSGHAMEWLLREDYEQALDLARQTLTETCQHIRFIADELASQTKRYAQVQHLLINTSHSDQIQLIPLHLTTPRHIKGFCLKQVCGEPVEYQITNVYTGDKDYQNKDYNEVDVVCALKLPPFGFDSLTLDFDGSSAEEKARRDLPLLDALDDKLEDSKQNCDGLRVNNGCFDLRIKAGQIQSIQLNDGQLIFERIGDRDFCTVQFFHTTPTDNWTTCYDDIRTDNMCYESFAYPEQGPLRWKIIQRGSVGQQAIQQVLTIHRDDPVLSWELILDNAGIEGYFTGCFPGQAAEIDAGIPFGMEARRVEEYRYSDPDPKNMNTGLFYERGCPGLFYARHFSGFMATQNGYLAIMQGDCGVYFRSRPVQNSVELILMRSFNLSCRTEKWVRQVSPSIMAKGEQTFHFGLAILGEKPDGHQLHALANRYEHPVVTAVRYSYEGGHLAATHHAVTLRGGTLTLSACYQEEKNLHMRFFESNGCKGETIIQTAFPFSQAEVVDLTGAVCDNAELAVLSDHQIKLIYQPWKIITIKLIQNRRTE